MTMEEKIDLILEKADKIDKIDMLIEKTDKIDMLIEKTNKIDLILEEVRAMENDMQERMTALEKDHESINRTLILIEDDTSNKIPALFDGYSFHQQHLEADEKRLDVLENVVDEHSIRISALEQVN